MGKSGGSAKVEVNEYYMSIHMGICIGPVDALQAIYIGEKLAWSGEATANQVLNISQPALFGGEKKEGGAVGMAYFQPGFPASVDYSFPANLAARLGLTADTCPAFKGFASLFFVGDINSATGGFRWGNNNPYMRSVWAKVRRRSNAFPAKAGESSNYSNLGTESNPAHMIYECLTNTDWGMGASPTIIDLEAFQDLAKLLHQEKFGLSMIWTAQDTIENFVNEIITHIQANIFVHPRTGLLSVKAIRGDYIVDSLPQLTRDNCKITKFDRKLWGETINELNISWTNPESEEEETVTFHDLANIEMQGSIVSETRNYYGIRSRELAMKVAARDMSSASAPLAAFEIEADRSFWDTLPGSVVRLTYPEYGIENLVLRVGKVDRGRPGDSVVKINAIEDVYGLPQSAYTVPGGSSWQDSASAPYNLEYFMVMTLPYFFAARVAAAAALTAEYPDVFLGVLGGTENRDTRAFELFLEQTNVNGDLVYETVGTKPVTAYTVLGAAVPAEAQSLVTAAALNFASLTNGSPPTQGSFAVLGGGSDDETEIVMISSIGPNFSNFTFERGVLDTVPRAWPAGTPVRFIDLGLEWADYTVFSDTQAIKYKALSSTSIGTLLLEQALERNETASGRPYYPLRPANVTVQGQGFGIVWLNPADSADIPVAWARRNRLTEDTQLVKWGEPDVTPEAGQTTTVEVLNMSGTVITAHTGLTGTTFSLPRASFVGANVGIVRVKSVRDGYSSLQSHEITVSFGTGYGTDYGNNYGDA